MKKTIKEKTLEYYQSELPKCFNCGKQLDLEQAIKQYKVKRDKDNCICNAKECIIKRKEKTSMEKFGVPNASKSKLILDKVKQTNLERYGVEHHTKSKSYQDKIKESNLEKYGCEHFFQSEEIQNKIKQTNLERYGVDNPFKCENVKDKIKQTNLKKYNCEYIGNSEEIQNKIKQTNLERYGVKCSLHNEDIKNKAIQTNLERYGVENPIKNRDIQNKIKQTNLERYGVEYPSQINNIKLKKYIEFNNSNWQNEFNNKNKNICSVPLDSIWNGSNGNLQVVCTRCNESYVTKLNDSHPTIHDKCKINGYSLQEKELLEFIKANTDCEVIENDRTIISPLELDVYIPKLKVAFEYNGLYWHSFINKSKGYHKEKSYKCYEQGITLVHIWENDWANKNNIIKNKILHILKKDNKRIFARKCKVINLNNKDKKIFLEQNHIQGDCPSTINLGLTYNNELVAVMTFGKSRYDKNYEYDLSRYATSCSVVGGASKLLSYFEKAYKPKTLVSYADCDYSIGNLYDKIGFERLNWSQPNYFYFKDNEILTRYKCQKNNLKKWLQNYNDKLTEKENMLNNGYNICYKSGTITYVKKY